MSTPREAAQVTPKRSFSTATKIGFELRSKTGAVGLELGPEGRRLEEVGVVVDRRDGVEGGPDSLDERAGRGSLSGQPEGRRNERER